MVKLFRIRRNARIQGGVIATDIAMTIDAAGVVVRGVAGTIEERVAALERRLDHSERQLDEVRESLRVETAERKAEHAQLAETLKTEVRRLEAAVRELEQASIKINARALPVVLWGILLTTVGDWLAVVWWLGWTCAAVGAALSVWAALSLWRYRTEMIAAER